MAAVRVIPTLDKFEDRHARLALGFEAAAVEQFTLKAILSFSGCKPRSSMHLT
jgi:hypothetical protein